METVNVMSISGGKDSAAMLIHAVKELHTKNLLAVFCDTGNEHPMTYDYVKYLNDNLYPIKTIKADFSAKIEKKKMYIEKHWFNDLTKDVKGKWVLWNDVEDESLVEYPPNPVDEMGKYKRFEYKGNKFNWSRPIAPLSEQEAHDLIKKVLNLLKPTGNPFLDMAIWKGRFPSTKSRFCTQELKIIPTFEQIYNPLLDEGKHVVSWQGVRADESVARSKLPVKEMTPEGFEIYRPLLSWTAKDVFDKHDQFNIEVNPLYKMGMGRVGCMPCISVGKDELYEIQRRFPEEIARIREWEKIVTEVSKRQGASFLPAMLDDDRKNIDDWVEWSKTSYGGKEYDAIKLIEQTHFPQCSSVYGLCE